MFIMALRLGTVAAIHQQSLHFTLTVTANSGRVGADDGRGKKILTLLSPPPVSPQD